MGPAVTLTFEPQPRTIPGLARAHDPKMVLRASRALTVLAVEEGTGRPGGASGSHGHGHKAGRLVARTSQDGGDTFGPPMAVSAEGAIVAGQGENAPSLVLGKRGLAALWEQLRPEGGTELLCSVSAMGNAWSAPIRVTDKDTPSTNGYSTLATGPDGSLWAVWLDGRNRSAGTLDVYLARSVDGGKSFQPNVLVAKGACPCCRPAIAITADGAAHVAWRGVTDSDVRDVQLATSTDGGKTWSAPRNVWRDQWVVMGCPHTGPALVAWGRTLHLAWYSEARGGASMGVRHACSTDGGRSFSKPTIVSQGVADSNHPHLTVNGAGRVHLLFQARPSGWTPLRTYVAEVTTPETVKQGIRPVPGKYAGVSYPCGLFDTAGRLWVAWTGEGSAVLSRAREETRSASR
jgi:hypothetical protein